MEAKDLMIGDWVSLDGYVLKVTDLSTNDYGEYAPIQLSSKEGCAGTIEAEPIPFIEEILKANGFRCVNENSAYTLMVMSDDGYTIEVYICIANCVFNVEHNYTLNKERVMDRIHKCGYFVHELQHALRLCGLDDLADNFKLE